MLAGNGGINNKLTFRKSFGLNLGKSGESVYVPKISQNSNKKKDKVLLYWMKKQERDRKPGRRAKQVTSKHNNVRQTLRPDPHWGLTGDWEKLVNTTQVKAIKTYSKGGKVKLKPRHKVQKEIKKLRQQSSHWMIQSNTMEERTISQNRNTQIQFTQNNLNFKLWHYRKKLNKLKYTVSKPITWPAPEVMTVIGLSVELTTRTWFGRPVQGLPWAEVKPSRKLAAVCNFICCTCINTYFTSSATQSGRTVPLFDRLWPSKLIVVSGSLFSHYK